VRDRRRERERFTADERRALIASMVGGSLVPLNSTMIAVALPAIAAQFGVAPGRAAVLVTAYLVAMLVFQPIGGRLGDKYGHRALATSAMVAFAAASVMAAAAPTFPVLLAARCLQAVAGSAFSPNLQAILRQSVSATRRGRAFGLMGSGIGVGAAVGPVVGGLLVSSGSWRGVFLVNAPFVIPAIVLLGRLAVSAPDARSAATASTAAPPVLPLKGALLRPAFIAACATQAGSNFAMYGLLLLLPLVLAAAGWTTPAIGLALSGLTVGMLLLAPIGGMLGDRYGRRRMIVAGTSAAAAGCAVVAIGTPDPVALVAGALVLGCGQGLAGASLQTTALEAVPDEVTASAAGFFSTSRYAGSIVSSVVIAGVATDAGSSARSAAVAIAVGALAAAIVAVGARGRGASAVALADARPAA
jgi:MFS family permease